ncbi:uncharacterized protein IL334_003885 [Kwoniella shivajii]|uniref:Spindle pole body-associated protein cut12 domain-containing protein n=1 Tax=Kwoniella shivajii TaxID=564305 RepID=A0ABZ1D0J6_9TREE|nr:hypothetical protein IL334_003885 [Kwoniella shivajii]
MTPLSSNTQSPNLPSTQSQRVVSSKSSDSTSPSKSIWDEGEAFFASQETNPILNPEPKLYPKCESSSPSKTRSSIPPSSSPVIKTPSTQPNSSPIISSHLPDPSSSTSSRKTHTIQFNVGAKRSHLGSFKLDDIDRPLIKKSKSRPNLSNTINHVSPFHLCTQILSPSPSIGKADSRTNDFDIQDAASHESAKRRKQEESKLAREQERSPRLSDSMAYLYEVSTPGEASAVKYYKWVKEQRKTLIAAGYTGDYGLNPPELDPSPVNQRRYSCSTSKAKRSSAKDHIARSKKLAFATTPIPLAIHSDPPSSQAEVNLTKNAFDPMPVLTEAEQLRRSLAAQKSKIVEKVNQLNSERKAHLKTIALLEEKDKSLAKATYKLELAESYKHQYHSKLQLATSKLTTEMTLNKNLQIEVREKDRRARMAESKIVQLDKSLKKYEQKRQNVILEKEKAVEDYRRVISVRWDQMHKKLQDKTRESELNERKLKHWDEIYLKLHNDCKKSQEQLRIASLQNKKNQIGNGSIRNFPAPAPITASTTTATHTTDMASIACTHPMFTVTPNITSDNANRNHRPSDQSFEAPKIKIRSLKLHLSQKDQEMIALTKEQ